MDTKVLYCLAANDGYVQIDAKSAIQVFANQYKMSINDAWQTIRRNTFSRVVMGIIYPPNTQIGNKLKKGNYTYLTEVVFPPQELLILNPNMVEAARHFVESGVEA